MSRNITGTRAEQVLRWLARQPQGKRFTEIQRYIVERVQGHDWDERKGVFVDDPYSGRIKVGEGRRRYRGVWSDHLTMETDGRPGILTKFCRKGLDGRYRVVKPIKPPFFAWSDEEKMQQHMETKHADGTPCWRYPNYPKLER